MTDPSPNVLVLGTGQVGTELMRAAWPAGLRPEQRGRDRLDLGDRAAIAAAIAERPWTFVVNAAAYTAVDKAEADAEPAEAVNRDAPAAMAAACAKAGVPLLHISTDYVFDGTKAGPYTEDDPVAPLGVYGTSKEAGERAIRAVLDRHVILRTAWVFSAHGHNFVKTMLRLAGTHDSLRVVVDQHGGPTAAAAIAAAIVRVAEAVTVEGRDDLWGTYHFCGAPATTWHGLAEAVVDGQSPVTGRKPPVRAIATEEYPTPAKRPANSILDCRRFESAFGLPQPDWRQDLADVLAELMADQAAPASAEGAEQ